MCTFDFTACLRNIFFEDFRSFSKFIFSISRIIFFFIFPWNVHLFDIFFLYYQDVLHFFNRNYSFSVFLQLSSVFYFVMLLVKYMKLTSYFLWIFWVLLIFFRLSSFCSYIYLQFFPLIIAFLVGMWSWRKLAKFKD